MPRGNDADAASRELAARYRTRGNAEDLVQANMLRRDENLRKAGLLSRDDDATNDLELKDVQSEVDDENVVAYSVRGDYLVTVSEDEDGNVWKTATPRKDTRAEQDEKKREESDEPEQDADIKALAEQKAAISQAAREAEAEIEKATQEAREKAQEDAAKKTQEAADKAADDSGDSGDSGSSGGSASSGEQPQQQRATRRQQSSS